MINLGYETVNGRTYDCQFLEDCKVVRVIGPLPTANTTGSAGVMFEADAKTEKDARIIIKDAIKQGKIE